MSLFPKEHGAYGQLAFPLATSFAVAGVSTPALFVGLALVAGFLAHEPLLVLLGGRGPRAKREDGRRATLWLTAAATVMLGSGLFAWWASGPAVRLSFVLPLVPAAILAAALSFGKEKSMLAEIAVALVFSFAAIPLCLAAGAAAQTAAAVAVTFASIFLAGTLGVRAIIVRVRGGGNPRAARLARVLAVASTTAAFAGLLIAGLGDALPWTALAAAAPGLIAAATVAVRVPSPTRLRTVGWTLVSTSAAAAVILLAGLSAAP